VWIFCRSGVEWERGKDDDDWRGSYCKPLQQGGFPAYYTFSGSMENVSTAGRRGGGEKEEEEEEEEAQEPRASCLLQTGKMAMMPLLEIAAAAAVALLHPSAASSTTTTTFSPCLNLAATGGEESTEDVEKRGRKRRL
jgi:hypothetical protein